MRSIRTRSIRSSAEVRGFNDGAEAARHRFRDLEDDAAVEIEHLEVDEGEVELAPERLQVRPGELGFVSSNCWDVAGAASTGLETFWIQRRSAEPPEELGCPFLVDHHGH